MPQSPVLWTLLQTSRESYPGRVTQWALVVDEVDKGGATVLGS